MAANIHKALEPFHPAVREWFGASFAGPTRAQQLGWPSIARGDWTLITAPTGSGKTLTAFLWALDRLMFAPRPPKEQRCRVLYLSPLKALAVDVERNLRAPLAGIANVAQARGDAFTIPEIAIRTGDTPQSERARFGREPADILITTPESIYLMLTSNARDVLRGVETIIIDEIHALVPNKRGAHMALSLERLARRCITTPQRIGLSATQHPLEEVARFLGGAIPRDPVGAAALAPPDSGDDGGASPAAPTLHHEFAELARATFRPVTIVDTGEKKKLTLRVEVPVEDMAKLADTNEIVSGPASLGPRSPSIWPAVHPRLLELIRSHTSTLIFVNSRRLAERLAGALNELAGETLVQAHHGSIARPQRIEIEDALKSGRLPALVATSSLELGIDMGAIDLVIQIESPPSIASGMQRIGRASHQVGASSEGIIFPKFRGDLVACAAVAEAMHSGAIEPTRYPRNPLDVLAQQIVAMVAVDAWSVDDLFAAIRTAAPYAELSRTAFDGVLDMLSGLYPSDEFAELRPRLTWDRVANTVTSRQGSKRVAITSGGTIPDRGLYGVFLAGAEGQSGARVGELDEEMVFETSVGETFVLGASTWRIEDITHDRVVVTPAPGQPGKMPFWKADSAERTVPFGRAIGKLVREIRAMPKRDAVRRLTTKHDLDVLAAGNFLQYLDDQHEATGAVPDDRTIVVERVLDELGDWRVCVLSPFGGKVHAPWAMAVSAQVRQQLAIEVETMWSDDGFIVRFPETDAPPASELVIPDPDEAEGLLLRQLGASSMFAAKFREAAARALLLPRMRIQGRTPLWQQRKRAYDLLQVASRFGSFPIILEAYREVLRDVFDVPAMIELLRHIRARTLRVVTADTAKPSPFAASVLFRYVANFLYDGDAPLAERRAQALAIDQSQLRELLGEPELRELLDPNALEQTELELQHLDPNRKAKSADGIHDLLLRLGDLSLNEIEERFVGATGLAPPNTEAGGASPAAPLVRDLVKQRRIVEVTIAREKRFIAVEDASRYRDALGTPLPVGIPERFLQPVADAVGDLVLRFARTHGPFTPHEVARRYGLGVAVVTIALERFVERGRLIEGEFRPGGTQREWCDNDVLRTIRRRSLAKLRKEAEPVDPPALARLFTSWQGVVRKRRGLDGLLEIVETLQGYPLAASTFERDVLAARVEEYRPSDLDTLSAAGEIVWVGVEPLGEKDGRIALYLTDHLPLLRPVGAAGLAPPRSGEEPGGASPAAPTDQRVLEYLAKNGASFFAQIQAAVGGFPAELIDALWDLVWRGAITNDTFHALRSFTRPKAPRTSGGFRSRRVAPASTQGRWSLVPPPAGNETQRANALAQQLLTRYGVVTREAPGVEGISGGFSAVYPILKALEEAGRIRRGYFVAGLGATQFASGGAIDLLRSLREEPDTTEAVLLAATDPANPYGAIVKWPDSPWTLSRSVGAEVILVNGLMACYITRGEKQLYVFLPEDEPQRSNIARGVAKTLASVVREGGRRALLITEVNDEPVARSAIAPFLAEEGFTPSAMGYQKRSDARG
ncbi:MAG TPA: crosslink repair DNA glycosylase YcaQ family protein [Thermoanaerobaculia bacterium]|nr:crosslink repair DNA glycosylase YcaQ family protein [Thermoanaerobaculia bacterium]